MEVDMCIDKAIGQARACIFEIYIKVSLQGTDGTAIYRVSVDKLANSNAG